MIWTLFHSRALKVAAFKWTESGRGEVKEERERENTDTPTHRTVTNTDGKHLAII